MSCKTLYVTDLDGTLLGPDSKLSAASIGMLNEAISGGAMVSVATARTPATVSMLLKDVNFRIPLVVMTGVALWDKISGDYSDVQYFSPEKVREITEAYRSVSGGEGFLYTLSELRDTLRTRPEISRIMEIYHIGPLNAVEREFMEERLSSPYKKFHVPESGGSDIPRTVANAVLFFGMNQVKTAEKIKENLDRIENINPMYYHDWHGDEVASVEAFPEGATKANAIQRLKERVGAERVVVFGDNVNDLSMMRAADWSVAVANALPEVKEAADEVIGSNAEDAVARYVFDRVIG